MASASACALAEFRDVPALPRQGPVCCASPRSTGPALSSLTTRTHSVSRCFQHPPCPIQLSTSAAAYSRRRPSSFVVRAAESEAKEDGKVPFGYTRKDVIGIGLGLTGVGFGLRYGLEYGVGLDGIQAGNVVQLVMVLGLCLGWVSTYLWRVGNKEMTYAQQLRDYESAVMQKRLEQMPEAELEAMLAEVEEEKQRLLANRKD